ncbi:hypothetical protein C4D60_Mb01t09860 [Musa balbisiana]|uniref:Uncharacterized protein n=1 Tax=Musa balbisiana TaxID=52838 RepID=A0A4S8JN43_MUSBA|nr:hypothetical protein C4D60_Mb01t09860 [Musa balbisiana]
MMNNCILSHSHTIPSHHLEMSPPPSLWPSNATCAAKKEITTCLPHSTPSSSPPPPPPPPSPTPPRPCSSSDHTIRASRPPSGVLQTAGGHVETRPMLHGLRQLDQTARAVVAEVDRHGVVRVGQDIEGPREVPQRGGHGVGVEPPLHAALCPPPGFRREYHELGAPREPAGEGDHLVLRGVPGVEGEHRELRSLGGPRELNPSHGDGADDVEHGVEARVGEQQAVAAVDDGGAPMEGEELEAAFTEAAAGRAREPGLLARAVAAAVEDSGGEQGKPPPEVVVGDKAVPFPGDAAKSEQGLDGEPGEDLKAHVVAHGCFTAVIGIIKWRRKY